MAGADGGDDDRHEVKSSSVRPRKSGPARLDLRHVMLIIKTRVRAQDHL